MIAAPRRVGRCEAELIDGLTGVWTRGAVRKIGSIGVHVNRGITTHGFAINVNNDLQPFEWIVPCGIEACRMTSVSRELGAEQDLDAFVTTVRDRFGEVYEREPVEVAAASSPSVVGIEALAGDRGATVVPVEPRRHSTERLHVTRSRANPGGARGDRRGGPFRERKPPWLKVPAPGRPDLPAPQGDDRRATTCTRSARRPTAPTSASAGSAAPPPS